MRKKLKLTRDEAQALYKAMENPVGLRERILVYLNKDGVDVSALGNDTIRYDPIMEEAVIGEVDRWKPSVK